MEKDYGDPSCIIETTSYAAQYYIQATPETKMGHKVTKFRLGQSLYPKGILLSEIAKDPNKGYSIIDTDSGRLSWMPKDKFEKKYRSVKENLTFGIALEAVKCGLKIARKG